MDFGTVFDIRRRRMASEAGLVLLFVLLAAQTALARSAGIVNYSSNPDVNSGFDCQECHTGGVVNDPEFVRIVGRGTVVAGETGFFSVDIDSSNNRPNCGVGISATAGQLIASDSDTRLAVNSLGENEVVHDRRITSCGGIGFQWVAPMVAEPTTVLFYVGGIRSDGAGQSDDRTGTAIYRVAVLPGVEPREVFTFVSVLSSGQTGAIELDDPSDIVFGPGDSELYVAGRSDGALVGFKVDPIGGDVTHFQTVQNGLDGVEGLRTPTGLAITDDGTRLYVSDAGIDRITAFDRDSGGDLSFVSAEPSANRRDLSAIALSPDGEALYIAAEDRSGGFNAGVVVFALDTGLPVAIQTLNAGGFPESPQALVASPDSEFLYVAGFNPNGIFVLKRDPGELTLANPIQHQRDDVDGAHGIGGPRSMAMSPDGLYLYTTDRTADSLVVHERDVDTGLLTFLQALKRSDDVVDGLQDPSDLSVSNSGRFVYVIGNATEGSLSVFERDFASGLLSPVDEIFASDSGFEALDGAQQLAVNASGSRLYVASNRIGFGSILVVPEPNSIASSVIALLCVLQLFRRRRPHD